MSLRRPHHGTLAVLPEVGRDSWSVILSEWQCLPYELSILVPPLDHESAPGCALQVGPLGCPGHQDTHLLVPNPPNSPVLWLRCGVS
jgi:hypothetical protein